MSNKNLVDKLIHASLWTAGISYFFYIVNFIGQIILAKQLHPIDYGQYAFIAAIVEILGLLLSFSSTAGFINSQGRQEDFNVCFMLNVYAGSLFISIGMIGAIIVSLFFSTNPALILLALCLSQALTTFGYVYIAPRQRDLEFKGVMLIQGSASLISLLLAVLSAFAGFSVWSLVLRDILNGLILLSIAYLTCKTKYDKSVSAISYSEQFSFGLRTTVSRVMELGYYRVPDILIKLVLGKAILGNFYQARVLACYPIKLIEPFTQKVLFSFFSRIKDDKSMLADRLQWFNLITLIALLPIIFVIYVFGQDIFVLIYGAKWALAGKYFQHFSFWILLAALFNCTAAICYSLKLQLWVSQGYLLSVLCFVSSLLCFQDAQYPALFFSLSLLLGYIYVCARLSARGFNLQIFKTVVVPIAVLLLSITSLETTSTLTASLTFIVLYACLLVYYRQRLLKLFDRVKQSLWPFNSKEKPADENQAHPPTQ